MRSVLIGLGLAGLAIWAGKRSGMNIKEKLDGLLGNQRSGQGGAQGQTGSWGSQTGSTAGGARAHTPDGSDASGSFRAGIADENIIPETAPAI